MNIYDLVWYVSNVGDKIIDDKVNNFYGYQYEIDNYSVQYIECYNCHTLYFRYKDRTVKSIDINLDTNRVAEFNILVSLDEYSNITRIIEYYKNTLDMKENEREYKKELDKFMTGEE